MFPEFSPKQSIRTEMTRPFGWQMLASCSHLACRIWTCSSAVSLRHPHNLGIEKSWESRSFRLGADSLQKSCLIAEFCCFFWTFGFSCISLPTKNWTDSPGCALNRAVCNLCQAKARAIAEKKASRGPGSCHRMALGWDGSNGFAFAAPFLLPMMSIYINLSNMFWWSLRTWRGSLQIVFIHRFQDRSRKRRGPGVAFVFQIPSPRTVKEWKSW